jgi:hypothetical protein
MAEYNICIPSYGRPQILQDKTLTTLKRMCIHPDDIYIYVIQEEFEQYKQILDKTMYNDITIGVLGLPQQREFISSKLNSVKKFWQNQNFLIEKNPLGFFEIKQIVYMDDDIQEIDLKYTNFSSLDIFIQNAFKACSRAESYIWGIYPVWNPFFREKQKKDVTTDLRYICGCMYGIINRKKDLELQLKITLENGEKEDVERTCLFWKKDGVVLRYNKIGAKTKYYGKEGGLGNFKSRLEKSKIACEKLKEHFPLYGNIKVRKNGMSEFVFISKNP